MFITYKGPEKAAEETSAEQPPQRKHLGTGIAFCLALCCLWPESLLVITVNSWIKNVGMGAKFLDTDISRSGTLLKAEPGWGKPRK